MASKFFLTLSTLATGAVASKILILGDSMGEFTCGSEGYPGTNHFKETCKGSEVINKAAAGTTAYQWRVGGDQEASEAFAAAGSGVTHVWLSVGGNDFQSPAEGKSTPSFGLGAFGVARWRDRAKRTDEGAQPQCKPDDEQADMDDRLVERNLLPEARG